MAHRLRCRDAVSAPPDDDAQLGLEVERRRAGMADDRVAVAADRVGELGEEERALGEGDLLFLHVVAVVEPDADDLARA